MLDHGEDGGVVKAGHEVHTDDARVEGRVHAQPRRHACLEHVVRNAMLMLNGSHTAVGAETAATWQLQIFHGTENLEHITACFGAEELAHVQLISLEVELTAMSKIYERIEFLGITIIPLSYCQLTRVASVIAVCVLPFDHQETWGYPTRCGMTFIFSLI